MIQLILILVNLKHKNGIVVNMHVHINFCWANWAENNYIIVKSNDRYILSRLTEYTFKTHYICLISPPDACFASKHYNPPQ